MNITIFKHSRIVLLFFLILVLFSFSKPIVSPPTVEEIIKNVNGRNEGEHVLQNFNMVLTNKAGKTQSRDTKIFRKDYNDNRKSIILFTNPTNVKGTAFMSFDYNDNAKDDDQWLYLPALKKTRRISAANRGDYFLGTDFTYEDIKLGGKIGNHDYSFEIIKEEGIDGKKCYLIEGIPISEKIGKELGYSKVQFWVDSEIWIIRKSKYWDIAGNPLKTTQGSDIKKVDGIWTLHKIRAENHKTGHKTEISFSSVDYRTNISDDLFTEESLLRGVN